MMKQKVIVRTPDQKIFVQKLLELGAMGGKLNPQTVPRLSSSPYSAELLVELEDRSQEIKPSPYIIAFPIPPELYTEEQMRDMVWEEFRVACAQVGVKGRDREKMLSDYLLAVKSLAKPIII